MLLTARPLVYGLGLLLLAVPACVSAQSRVPLPLTRRTEAIQQMLMASRLEFSERTHVDECSILRLLDGDTSAVMSIRGLREPPEDRVLRSSGLKCEPPPRPEGEGREDAPRWLVVDSIVAQGDTVRIRTRRYWPEYVRSEQFSMVWTGMTYKVERIVIRPSLHGTTQPILPPSRK